MIFSSDQIPQTQAAGNLHLYEIYTLMYQRRFFLLAEFYQPTHFNSIVGFGFISPLKTHRKIRESYLMW